MASMQDNWRTLWFPKNYFIAIPHLRQGLLSYDLDLRKGFRGPRQGGIHLRIVVNDRIPARNTGENPAIPQLNIFLERIRPRRRWFSWLAVNFCGFLSA